VKPITDEKLMDMSDDTGDTGTYRQDPCKSKLLNVSSLTANAGSAGKQISISLSENRKTKYVNTGKKRKDEKPSLLPCQPLVSGCVLDTYVAGIFAGKRRYRNDTDVCTLDSSCHVKITKGSSGAFA